MLSHNIEKKILLKGAQAILQVAEKLFAQKGFEATSISEIAKGAGVSKANIYHHFRSKEHLYQKSLEIACERIFNVMELTNTSLSVDPTTRLKRYIKLHLKNMLEEPIATNLIKREFMDNNQIEGKMLAKDIFTNIFTKVVSLVFDVHEIDKNSRDINASLQAFMLIGLNVFFFDSQSVMKYLPGLSLIADTPELFSSKIFDSIMNTDCQNIQSPDE